MMERASILVGKCYRNSSGVTYEVTSYDGLQVHFVVRAGADGPSPAGRRGAEPWEVFLHEVQGEVPCPQT